MNALYIERLLGVKTEEKGNRIIFEIKGYKIQLVKHGKMFSFIASYGSDRKESGYRNLVFEPCIDLKEVVTKMNVMVCNIYDSSTVLRSASKDPAYAIRNSDTLSRYYMCKALISYMDERL